MRPGWAEPGFWGLDGIKMFLLGCFIVINYTLDYSVDTSLVVYSLMHICEVEDVNVLEGRTVLLLVFFTKYMI